MKTLRSLTTAIALAATPALVMANPNDTSNNQQKGHEKDVKQRVLPAHAGIQAAEDTLDALYASADKSDFKTTDTKKTLSLARDGIQLAIDNAQRLNTLSGLSNDAKQDARDAATKLNEAKTRLASVQRQLGRQSMSDSQREQVRKDLRDVKDRLSSAKDSLKKVGDAYDVNFDVDMSS